MFNRQCYYIGYTFTHCIRYTNALLLLLAQRPTLALGANKPARLFVNYSGAEETGTAQREQVSSSPANPPYDYDETDNNYDDHKRQ